MLASSPRILHFNVTEDLSKIISKERLGYSMHLSEENSLGEQVFAPKQQPTHHQSEKTEWNMICSKSDTEWKIGTEALANIDFSLFRLLDFSAEAKAKISTDSEEKTMQYQILCTHEYSKCSISPEECNFVSSRILPEYFLQSITFGSTLMIKLTVTSKNDVLTNLMETAAHANINLQVLKNLLLALGGSGEMLPDNVGGGLSGSLKRNSRNNSVKSSVEVRSSGMLVLEHIYDVPTLLKYLEKPHKPKKGVPIAYTLKAIPDKYFVSPPNPCRSTPTGLDVSVTTSSERVQKSKPKERFLRRLGGLFGKHNKASQENITQGKPRKNQSAFVSNFSSCKDSLYTLQYYIQKLSAYHTHFSCSSFQREHPESAQLLLKEARDVLQWLFHLKNKLVQEGSPQFETIPNQLLARIRGITGDATFKYQDSNYFFSGFSLDGKPFFKGCLYMRSKKIYEGEWENGPQGYGRLYASNGKQILYEGYWEQGKCHGYGKSPAFVGEWVEGKSQGVDERLGYKWKNGNPPMLHFEDYRKGYEKVEEYLEKQRAYGWGSRCQLTAFYENRFSIPNGKKAAELQQLDLSGENETIMLKKNLKYAAIGALLIGGSGIIFAAIYGRYTNSIRKDMMTSLLGEMTDRFKKGDKAYKKLKKQQADSAKQAHVLNLLRSKRVISMIS